MASIAKNRARSLAAIGTPIVGYVDLPYPGVGTRKHVSITVGDHVVRVELAAARKLANDILDACNLGEKQ